MFTKSETIAIAITAFAAGLMAVAVTLALFVV